MKGAEILFYPTAIGNEPQDPTLNSKDHWQRTMQGHAAANMTPLVASNRIGKEHGEAASLTFFGASFIADPTGAKVAEADGENRGVITATFDLDAVAAQRASWGLFRDRRPDLYGALQTADGTFGIVLAVGALTAYGDSAYAMSTAGRKTEPYGFERITRHGFAIGLALVGVAHALLATRLTGTVFFVGLAAFGWFGSLHQDAKLHARRDEHGEFLDKTSMVPFAAIAAGRTRLVVSELGLVPLALGLLAAWGIREAHPHIFAAGGLYVVAGTLVGAGVATVQDMRRARDRGLAGVTGS